MDAVLGRRSAGGEGAPYFVSPEQMTERRLDSIDRTGSLVPDFSFNTSLAEISRHHIASLGKTGRLRLNSLEEGGGRQSWQLDSEVKLEDREDSVDEFEFSSAGFSQKQKDRQHELDQESSTLQELRGMYCDEVCI